MTKMMTDKEADAYIKSLRKSNPTFAWFVLAIAFFMKLLTKLVVWCIVLTVLLAIIAVFIVVFRWSIGVLF